MGAQEFLFASIFALLIAALAVYFAFIIRLAWRRVASVFFPLAGIAGCAWFWSLCAAGFVEYWAWCARHFRHTQVAYDPCQVSGVFIFLAAGAFMISFAGLVLGITEALLRRRKSSNQPERTAGSHRSRMRDEL
jgi:hypothetical protein